MLDALDQMVAFDVVRPLKQLRPLEELGKERAKFAGQRFFAVLVRVQTHPSTVAQQVVLNLKQVFERLSRCHELRIVGVEQTVVVGLLRAIAGRSLVLFIQLFHFARSSSLSACL